MSGFDVQAKILLRSTAEYMEALVAIIDNPDLASEFAILEEPGKSGKFWKKHLARGKVRYKIRKNWDEFFVGEEQATVQWFANWGHRSMALLAGLSHPTMAGGFFTAIPLKSKYSEKEWPSMFGERSDASVSTISIYMSFIFPILLVCRGFPFDIAWPHVHQKIKYDANDELHRHVHIGRDVLSSLVLSLVKETNLKYVYPEPDLSIFPDYSSFL